MTRYYTYAVSISGRKKNVYKDGSVRWSIDMIPQFPKHGFEYHSAEVFYPKARHGIFTTLFWCFTKIENCHDPIAKLLVGILETYGAFVFKNDFFNLFSLSLSLSLSLCVSISLTSSLSQGVGNCVKTTWVTPWWNIVLHKSSEKAKCTEHNSGIRDTDQMFIEHVLIKPGDRIAICPQIDRFHAFDCELRKPGVIDKSDAAFSNSEFEFDVDEEFEEHIGDLFLTSAGYNIERARWDLAVRLSHCNKQLALAVSNDKKLKIVRSKGGTRKMSYWPYDREIVFHLFEDRFEGDITKKRKCITVDLQEILSNVTERWLYSTHVLEAFNSIIKSHKAMYLTPEKASVRRMSSEEVEKFDAKSGWPYHVKITDGDNNFMICAFPDKVNMEIFESKFKRVLYP